MRPPLWARGFLYAVLLSIGAGCSFLNAAETETETDASVPAVLVRGENKQFDWAKANARARIAYVSSGPRTSAVKMIDDDLQTAFRFSGNDAAPVVIVELAQSEQIHRVSAVFTAEVTRLDVYLLNQLPKDPSDLGYLTPFASVTEPGADGKATVDFAPSNTRYVALRWIRQTTRRPFDVAQVSAFSFAPAGPSDLISSLGGPSGDVILPPAVVAISPL